MLPNSVESYFSPPPPVVPAEKIVLPVQDDNGFWYYPTLPHNAVLANEFDFYNRPRGTPYILHGFYSDKLECYRTNENFNAADLQAWFAENRVYLIKT